VRSICSNRRPGTVIEPSLLLPLWNWPRWASDNPPASGSDFGKCGVGPAAGIEPATPCLLGSRSSELSYAGVWYPAQESNPETAGFADPPEIRLARHVVREAGLDPAAGGIRPLGQH
jgi:hypothetical protein